VLLANIEEPGCDMSKTESPKSKRAKERSDKLEPGMHVSTSDKGNTGSAHAMPKIEIIDSGRPKLCTGMEKPAAEESHASSNISE
jgi:hypothetical protein